MTLHADPEQIKQWFELLHPVEDDGCTDGLIHINSHTPTDRNWGGRTFSEHGNAVKYAVSLDDDLGIYTRTTRLARVPREGKRGGDEDSKMLPGYAADIDFPSPARKHTKAMPLVPGIDEAFMLVEQTGLPQPTLWVNSGWGLYPWWIFNTPLDLTDPDNMAQAKAISDKFQATLGRWADHFGWDYGTGVKDMSRVLRIPGTVNRKVADDHRMCHIMAENSHYEHYDFDEFAAAVLTAYDNAPVPVSYRPPRQEPKPRVEGSPLKPGEDFNERGSWYDILPQHGWVLSKPPAGRTLYWRRPGKEYGTSATTGYDASADRLFIFSTSTEFESWTPINKHHALAVLEFGGDHSAATRYLRAQGYGGELPKFDQAFDATSLVRPAAQVPVAVQAVDDEQPAQAVTVVEANEALPVLGHDGLPVFTEDVYRSQPWDDMGLVSMYSSAFCPGLRYVNAMDEWRVWNGQRWVRDDRQLHQLAARKLATGLRDQGRKAEAEGHEHAKEMKAAAGKLATMGKVMSLPKLARTDICMSSTPKDYDTHKYLVTVENGTLNLKTGKLDDFDPNLMLTKRIKAVYDPSAEGPRTRAFLSEIQPDPEVLAYMQRLVGATMLGNADERVLPIVHGASGSGKSAFLEMLYHVLADFAAVADPTTLMPQPDNYQGPSEKLHSLMGTRFVKMSELPENASLNQALVKSITGSDTQKTRPLYGHPVEWDVEYVVWMATNNLPKITSTDGAIWKRVKPIHFPNVFVNEDGSVKSGAGDKDLGRQLAREEGSFILNWIMQGIAEYLDKGLAEPAQIGAWLTGYRDEMDTTRQFMAEAQENGQIKVEEGLTVPARDLYKVYMAWTVEAQIKFPLSIKTFKQRMEVNGYEQIRAGTGMVWRGMGITGFIGAAQTPVSRNAGMEAWARQSGLRN